MDKQKLLFENLKSIKDNWLDASLKAINGDGSLIWSDCGNEYKQLRNILNTNQDREAYKKVLDEVVKGVLHSVLVMVDGGDALADSYKIDLIDKNTKESITEGIELHDEFFGYLIDTEEVR